MAKIWTKHDLREMWLAMSPFLLSEFLPRLFLCLGYPEGRRKRE